MWGESRSGKVTKTKPSIKSKFDNMMGNPLPKVDKLVKQAKDLNKTNKVIDEVQDGDKMWSLIRKQKSNPKSMESRFEKEAEKYLFDHNLRWQFIDTKIRNRIMITPDQKKEYEQTLKATIDLLKARDKEIVGDILPRVHRLRANIPLTGGMPARDQARALIKHLDNLLQGEV